MHVPKRRKHAVSQSVTDGAHVPKYQAIVVRVGELSLHEMNVLGARRIQRDPRSLLNSATRADRLPDQAAADKAAADKAESCSSLHLFASLLFRDAAQQHSTLPKEALYPRFKITCPNVITISQMRLHIEHRGFADIANN